MTLLAGGAARLIRGYQRFVSPLLPRACRFEPTCSEYARQAVLSYGVGRGAWLALRRLVRCHPFHPGGSDSLPSAPGAEPPKDPSRTWKSERSWPPS